MCGLAQIFESQGFSTVLVGFVKEHMEIILIDDGINDVSNEILKNFNKNKKIIILKNKSNFGK